VLLPSGSHAARQASSTTSYTMARRSWICPARAVRPRHPGPDLRIQRHESPGRFAALLEAVLLGLVRGQDQGRADVSGRDGRRRIIGVPPFFSPLRLDLAPEDFVPGTGDPGLEDPTSFQSNVLLAEWRV
jgi:hypothetical protein